MNEIKDCIDALLAAVQNSEEYQEFMKYKALVEQDPGLMEARELRSDPLVNAFLDAELALCKLMQRICKSLTEGIELDVPEL